MKEPTSKIKMYMFIYSRLVYCIISMSKSEDIVLSVYSQCTSTFFAYILGSGEKQNNIDYKFNSTYSAKGKRFMEVLQVIFQLFANVKLSHQRVPSDFLYVSFLRELYLFNKYQYTIPHRNKQIQDLEQTNIAILDFKNCPDYDVQLE